mgnify:CR=1 FL=1
MKAARIHEYGDASVVTVEETDKPIARDGQVVVEVHAASLNPFDSMVRQGYMQQMIPLELPVTIGGDIAGVVVEVGAEVDGVSVGDSVYGQANVVAGNSGAFAEFAATVAGQVAHAPQNVNSDEAAALPLVGVSALQALTDHIQLQPNQKIFINGGSGAIGRIAIQIAKHIGAHVATTATGEGIEVARAAGADEVIDYKSQDFTQLLSDYDAAFDTVGGDVLATLAHVVKDGGVVVSMAGEPVAERNITSVSQMTKVSTAKLDALRDLVESGVVTPGVGKVFNLDDIQQAFVARESGDVKGKVVLSIKK